MKIALVYFEKDLEKNRKHHEVDGKILKLWQFFYKKSKTKFEPFLLLDSSTKVPSFWNYDHIIISDDKPQQMVDVLNKVGWIKSQAYEMLGKCIVMDCDALILRNIDYLEDFDFSMGMAHDASERSYDNWKEIGVELNAGFMVFNSKLIKQKFKEIWHNKFNDFKKIFYFDELVFSAVNKELNGLDLGIEYNASWPVGDNSKMLAQYRNKKNNVLHFHGKRKNQINYFLSKINFI